MISVYKIWFYIMNLYVISFKSVYGTLKMNLKWKRYKISNFMAEACFLAERNWKNKVEDNLHISWARVVAN